MADKQERLEVIRRAVRSGVVRTQEALLSALKKRGMRVLQSTLSRDLAELGIRKKGGRYVLPAVVKPQQSILDYSSVVREVIPCGPHMIVVKTDVGQAQPVALAIDQSGESAFLATLAGDDVIYVATRDRRTQSVALRRLEQWFGGKHV